MKATQQKSWQQKIHRNELILQSIGEGVCGIDLEGKISFANPSALKMLGWKNDEIIGTHYNKVFFIKNADNAEVLDICPIQFALTVGETSHVNAETFFRQNGSSFLVEYVCVPLIESEKIIGAVVTFQDITERRDLEEALAQAHESAIQMANAKANFLANISHEIRTPLNGIIGMNNLLLETNLSTEQLNFSQNINKSAELLLEIVNDILDFSKIEAGKLNLEMIEFSLRELIEEVLPFFKVETNRKGLELNYQIEKDYQLIGDVIRLKQIFNNIIGNAVKFTKTGKINLEVKNIAENKFRFSVKDTGIGIAENEKVNLFQPFSQADDSTTRRFGGTGLGLAICKQLVELMNGEIGVESEIGQGSEFWFEIELAEQIEKKQSEI
ncbi:MAG: ATP-binding protein, partial [Pyrinomonadaceae bacterium]|nr:ATP-binding protein [Pyrinomonadaceae bacterium]